MFKKYTLKLIFVVSIALFLPVALFAQGAVVGYAYGKAYIGNSQFPEYTTTTFPSSLQLDKLTHVIAVGLGVYTSGALKTNDLPGSGNGHTNFLTINKPNTLKAT